MSQVSCSISSSPTAHIILFRYATLSNRNGCLESTGPAAQHRMNVKNACTRPLCISRLASLPPIVSPLSLLLSSSTHFAPRPAKQYHRRTGTHHHLQAAVRLCDMSRDNVVHIAPVGSSTHLTLTSPIPFFHGDRFPTFNMPYNPRVVYIWPWWRQVIYGRCIVKRTFPRTLIVSTRFSLRFVPHCAKLVVSFNTHPLLW
jgi:hypothetical protein